MRQAVKTGLIAGFVMMTLELLVLVVPNGTATSILQYGSRIVFIAAIYLGIKLTKEKELNDTLSFKDGLKFGVLTAAIAGLLFSAYSFVAWTHLDMDMYMTEMRNAGLTNSKIRIALSNLTESNMLSGALFLAITNVIIGFFVSVVVTLLLRKSNNLLTPKI